MDIPGRDTAGRASEECHMLSVHLSRVDPIDFLMPFLLALHLPPLCGQVVDCILTPDNSSRGSGYLK